MSNWGGGYVTDIAYTTGWYRQQSPSIVSLACLLGGVVSPMPAGNDAVSYLELGCGHGYGAMLLAASNPAWRVTAVDFNPAHVAAAREWAAEAGLTNISFIEADLATLAGDPAGRSIPEADFVSMHGVWSWVPAVVRAGIVRLLRDKVRPGGAVHVSYNALPGWGSAMGMARMLRTVGRKQAERSDRQAEAGLRFIREMMTADAVQLKRSNIVQLLMEKLDDFPGMYLAHEYMNESWAPCFMAEVAEALADAKLEWVASANLVENFSELTLSEAQRALVNRFDDPLLRELIKDHCIDRLLRHDVFVRGVRRISPHRRDAALMDLTIGLNIRPQDLPLEAEMPAGRAELNPAFYQPIVRALADGPRRVGDLLQLPEIEGKRDNPAELVGILVGAELADLALRPDAPPSAAAQRFSRVSAYRLMQTEPMGRPVGVASQRMGTAVPASVLDLIVLDRTLAGEGSIDDILRFLATGIAITDEARLRAVLAVCLDNRLPRLRAAGVL
ncbi:MAG TPA: class I SAM-dependent methyltransferase [Acetobacteraceae bacterium]|nr:class I SAM-dependent methyltransferase [Acetobacteraceae bacterium]